MSYSANVRGKIEFTSDNAMFASLDDLKKAFPQALIRKQEGSVCRTVLVSGYIPYNEDIVFDVLNSIESNVLHGCLEYAGEDHFSHWKHMFIEKEGVWEERQGFIQYEEM